MYEDPAGIFSDDNLSLSDSIKGGKLTYVSNISKKNKFYHFI